VVSGHYTDHGAVEINPHWQINRKHVELRGCWGSRYEHFERAIALAASFGKLRPWKDLSLARQPLHEAASALHGIALQSRVKAIISPMGTVATTVE
jgi:L-iditol 2-dehydrogenase